MDEKKLNEEPLPLRKMNEKTGIEYILVGDYYVPNLSEPEPPEELGLYGMKRKRYLKENETWTYYSMLTEGVLWEHLKKIDEQAFEMEWQLINQMKKAQGVTEELKRTDQMKWVGMMNNIAAQAREVVMNELIYAE